LCGYRPRHWSKEAKLWLVLASAWPVVKQHLEAAGFTVTQEQQQGQQDGQGEGSLGRQGWVVGWLGSGKGASRVRQGCASAPLQYVCLLLLQA
jgi:hypothetical protein